MYVDWQVVGVGSGKMGVNAAPGHAVGMVNAASGTDVGVAKQTARVVNETRDPGNRRCVSKSKHWS